MKHRKFVFYGEIWAITINSNSGCGLPEKSIRYNIIITPLFFAMLFYNPRRYALLNSIIDSELLSFFQKSQFQLLVLKKHYDGDFKEFVDRLRMIYVFINQ